MTAVETVRPKLEKGKKESFLKDYINRLTDEDLRFLDMRLKHRLADDVADAVNFLSKNVDMDRHLSGSKGFEEFYDTLDVIQKQVEKEARRRHS